MRVRMKDIADRLGVSVNAVSLALNNKPGIGNDMRVKILRAANDMGYIETKEKFLRTFSINNLCVMMQKRYSDDFNFYGRVLLAVTEEARGKGFDTMVDFFDDDDFLVPKAVQEHRMAGVIVIGKIGDNNIAALQGFHIPLVLVDHASLSRQADSILTDNKLGGFLITKYLLDKGLRRIGFLGDLNYSLSIKERYFGYFEAMHTFQKVGSRLAMEKLIERCSIVEDLEHLALRNDVEGISEKLRALEEMPQAFVCSNDLAAIALQHSLQSLGYRVPQDISLTGFDDIDMAEKVIPRLTTIRVNKEDMGRLSVQKICQRISNRNAPFQNTVMSVDLIERDSVKKPPQ